MKKQLALSLSLKKSTQLEDYIAGENKVLIDALYQQRKEEVQPLIYLFGHAFSGRTHLLMGQCNAAESNGLKAIYLPCKQLIHMQPDIFNELEQADLLAIDDVHLLANHFGWEQALFHLFNRAQVIGCRLLFSANFLPKNSGFSLPDLISRLNWGLVYCIKPLNDTAREQLLISLGIRYGLQIPKKVAHYLIQRQPRDITSLIHLIEKLDKVSLQEKRCLTLPFVRDYLKGTFESPL